MNDTPTMETTMAHYDAHATRPAFAGLFKRLADAIARLHLAGNAPDSAKPETGCRTALEPETLRDTGICREYQGYSSPRDVGRGRDLHRTAERIRAGLPG